MAASELGAPIDGSFLTESGTPVMFKGRVRRGQGVYDDLIQQTP